MGYEKKSNKEINKEIEELLKSSMERIDNLFNSPEDIKKLGEYLKNFYRYSLRNMFLIESQFEGAIAVGSFKFWKEKGFTVNKGEKGIKVLVPTKLADRFEDREGNIKLISKATEQELELIKKKELPFINGVTVFKKGYVFDISQTNAKLDDIPKLFPNRWIEGNVKNYDLMKKSLENIAEKINVKIINPKSELGAAKGVTYLLTMEVALNPRNSEIQNIKTLVHELAHAKLHIGNDEISKQAKEFQAEFVAYTVCKYFDIDTSEYSFNYIKGWGKTLNQEDKINLLKDVRETTKEFIEVIEDTLIQEKNKENEFNDIEKINKELDDSEYIKIENEKLKETLNGDLIKVNKVSKEEFEEIIDKNNSCKFLFDGNFDKGIYVLMKYKENYRDAYTGQSLMSNKLIYIDDNNNLYRINRDIEYSNNNNDLKINEDEKLIDKGIDNIKISKEKEEEIFKKVNLHEEWLKTAGAKGERLVLEKEDLRGLNLENVDLRNAIIKSCDLRNTKIYADLSGADLRRSKIDKTSNFVGSNIKDMNMAITKLTIVERQLIEEESLHKLKNKKLKTNIKSKTMSM